MAGVIKEIEELQKKAEKYENMKTRYIEYGKELEKAINILTALKREIVPTISVGREKTSQSEKIEELYDKMLHGTEITRKLIEALYPNLKSHQSNYYLAVLGKMKHVEKEKMEEK